MANKQISPYLMMVRPANFGYNIETAKSNAFQQSESELSAMEISANAIDEFDAFVKKLRDHKVHVTVIQDTVVPSKPDAVFPNNWISFHQNGTIALYPMLAEVRRIERREDILETIQMGFGVQEIVHFEQMEDSDMILEGTGSLILDRVNRLAYACLSPRTNEQLLDWFCEKFDFKKVVFYAKDEAGLEIYHTNVMMALGKDFAVICLDSIPNIEERELVIEVLEESKKEIIEISYDQMMSFAGNMLQVENSEGKSYLVMSEQAYKSLNDRQIKQIESFTSILHSPLYTIEKFGGGSARCMMAEVFLPRK